MASVTICDHCGKPINKQARCIKIDVNDQFSTGMLRTGMGATSNWTPLDRRWDLHWECYDQAVRGTLEAAIGAP